MLRLAAYDTAHSRAAECVIARLAESHHVPAIAAVHLLRAHVIDGRDRLAAVVERRLDEHEDRVDVRVARLEGR